jgi:hypothetical protein
MKTFRAILVALVAMSVAMLPLPGGMLTTNVAAASVTAAPPDCCAHGKPCNKGPNDCGSVAGCALKCFSLSTAVLTTTSATPKPSAQEQMAVTIQTFVSASDNPPLPPPRV